MGQMQRNLSHVFASSLESPAEHIAPSSPIPIDCRLYHLERELGVERKGLSVGGRDGERERERERPEVGVVGTLYKIYRCYAS
jgi:hypothetical protein